MGDIAEASKVYDGVPLLDDESKGERIDYVDGVLICRTEDGCVHYVPEESVSRWSRWRDPASKRLKLIIYTDSGALPRIYFEDEESLQAACAKLCDVLGNDTMED